MKCAKPCCCAAAVAVLFCLLLAPPASAVAPAPAWWPVAVNGPTNVPPLQSEVQNVAVDAEGGTYTLSFKNGTTQTTAPIPFDATPTQVGAALNALSNIGGVGGKVTVTGGPGGPLGEHPYAITFEGSLANSNVNQLASDALNLTGSNQAVTVRSATEGGPGTATLAVYAQNVGGMTSSGTITVSVELSPGLQTAGFSSGEGWTCSGGAGIQAIACTSNQQVDPSVAITPILVPIRTVGFATGTRSAHVSVSGGGALKASYDAPIVVSAIPASPGYQAFRAGFHEADGSLSIQAGAHPFTADAAIFVNTVRTALGEVVPAGDPKDVRVSLPPGFVGNPTAVPACREGCDEKLDVFEPLGIAEPLIQGFGEASAPIPLMNIESPYGYPARFDFLVTVERISAVADVRSDEDYGVSIESPRTPQVLPVYGSFFTFWGAPADEIHNLQRCTSVANHIGCGQPPIVPGITAFLTNPTDCAEQAVTTPVTSLSLNTWLNPEQYSGTSVELPSVIGCDKLHFEGHFAFQPNADESVADSPASFSSELTVPDEGLRDPEKLAVPDLKKAVVRFPAGVGLNPSSADGLDACSEAEIGLKGTNFPNPNPIRFTKSPNTCPDSSKIGTLDLKSALIADTLHGTLYLATPRENPFGSLFAVYLVIEDPRNGLVIKLPGNVSPDPGEGQVTAIFDDLPQLPFTSMKLHFKGGARSPFATPSTCGRFTTVTEMTPWSAPESGPPTISEDSFRLDSGANGSPCANTAEQRPFHLGLTAGSTNVEAGAHTDFSFRLTRPDGAQELSGLEITTPVGFTASLSGVPYCPEAAIEAARAGAQEQARPSCPETSRVGTTTVGVGAGPHPYYVSGKLYLAGPYKGAPFSVVAITPAVAGPFDLGNAVVRSALRLDPTSAQLTAKTDPLPQFLAGVGLRIRDLRVALDRPDWAINPTSCDPDTVSVKAYGASGAVTELSSRSQMAHCDRLSFKPRFKARLRGGTRRGDFPSLIATLKMPEHNAAIASAAVTLPHSEFLEQGHIGTVCTRVQFAASTCPKASVYGTATATTPLLDQPLTGNVYLRSSNHKLPDLIVALRGPVWQPIAIDLVGRIDSVHGRLRAIFAPLPDAPISRFTLKMQGGRRGLLVNNRDLCVHQPGRIVVRIVAHNGKRTDQFPGLQAKCQDRRTLRHKHHSLRSRTP